MHWIVGSLFYFFLLFSTKLSLFCLLKNTTFTLSMFSPWFSIWREVVQGKGTAHEDGYQLWPKFTSSHSIFSFAVFWFLFFWFSYFAVQCLLSSFHFFVDLCSLFLASFSCPLSYYLPFVLILPSVTSNICVWGLDQHSSNFFKVLSLTGFHGNPRFPGVGRMPSVYALLSLFYPYFTIPFGYFHEKKHLGIWKSLN